MSYVFNTDHFETPRDLAYAICSDFLALGGGEDHRLARYLEANDNAGVIEKMKARKWQAFLDHLPAESRIGWEDISDALDWIREQTCDECGAPTDQCSCGAQAL